MTAVGADGAASFRDRLRQLRVVAKKAVGIEPSVRVAARRPLEYHGGAAGGWCILAGSLDANSVVVDVGLGEDISFSESIIRRYGCAVHGFDPTPRAITYVASRPSDHFRLHEFGLADAAGHATFYLPNDTGHVSGSVSREEHLGARSIQVELLTLSQLMSRIGRERIDLLKLDIEGTEYEVIEGESFRRHADRIGQLCIEFHHRWRSRGRASTERAVARLRELGFVCAWSDPTTNEEFLFVRDA